MARLPETGNGISTAGHAGRKCGRHRGDPVLRPTARETTACMSQHSHGNLGARPWPNGERGADRLAQGSGCVAAWRRTLSTREQCPRCQRWISLSDGSWGHLRPHKCQHGHWCSGKFRPWAGGWAGGSRGCCLECPSLFPDEPTPPCRCRSDSLRGELKAGIDLIGDGWSEGMAIEDLEILSLYLGLRPGRRPISIAQVAKTIVSRTTGKRGVSYEAARARLQRHARILRRRCAQAKPVVSPAAEVVVIHRSPAVIGTPETEYILVAAERAPCPPPR